ncbi:MAG TPA: hypothetical protein VER96_29275 [Polyangiaceae bacterium]|nr:hypothetical protein [Polyangiaceae bacterium]
MQADGPSPSQLVDPEFDRRQGYNGRVDASPDLQQLLLSDFASPPLYHLVNLTDPDNIEITELDMLGLTQWGVPMWSPDSTYLAIDATDYGDDPALVLDVLESPPTIRKLECSPDSVQQHCSFPRLFQR